jgi:hypothetical protein
LKNLCDLAREVEMRHSMNFHPVWGCLAPAPSFLRTVRTALVATAVGATAGGGVVLSLVDRSAGQTSPAERTLVRPDAVSALLNAPQTAPLNAQTIDQRQATEALRADGQVEETARNELSASPPVRQAVVAATAETRAATDDTSGKTAVSLSPTVQIRSKRVAERARHKDFESSSRQPPHSLVPQTAPNVIQRFWTGLTAAIEHGWSPPRAPANRTSRAHGNNRSATIS